MKNKEKRFPNCDDIYLIYKNYTPVDIFEKTRASMVVDYRVFFTMLCLNYTQETITSVGRYINKHHATVLHYQKNFESFCLNNKKGYTSYRDAEKEIIKEFPIVKKIKNVINPFNISMQFKKEYRSKVKEINSYKKLILQLENQLNTLQQNEV